MNKKYFFIGIAIILAILLSLITIQIASAACQIQYFGEAARMFGSAPRGNFSTPSACETYRGSSPAFERNNSRCVGCDSSSSGGYSGGGGSPQQQMMESILQPFFNNLFPPPDTSAQDEIARQNAIKQQKAAEEAKKAAIQRWLTLQSEDKLKIEMEQNAKIEQGKKLLSKTQTVGSGGELKPFSFGNPKLDLQHGKGFCVQHIFRTWQSRAQKM
jgi:hypothetical protein